MFVYIKSLNTFFPCWLKWRCLSLYLVCEKVWGEIDFRNEKTTSGLSIWRCCQRLSLSSPSFFHLSLIPRSTSSRPTLISGGCERGENKAQTLPIDHRAALSIDWWRTGLLHLPNDWPVKDWWGGLLCLCVCLFVNATESMSLFEIDNRQFDIIWFVSYTV